MYKRISILLLSLTWFLIPNTASAAEFAPTSIFFSPDQIAPGDYPPDNQVVTEYDNVTFEIKNTTKKTIDSLSIQTGNLAFKIAGSDYNSGLSQVNYQGGGIQFGSFQQKLGLTPDSTLIVKLTLQMFCIRDQVGNQFICTSNSTHTNTSTWAVDAYTWDINGNVTQHYNPTGNLLMTVTNSPIASKKPINFGLANEYTQGLSGSGITDPSSIEGLFPPGPIDSMLVLPINIATAILTSASNPGAYVAPNVNFFGYNLNFPSGQLIWHGLGGTVTFIASSAMEFFILYTWLTSLYFRLQRATMLDTHPNDTWGVL